MEAVASGIQNGIGHAGALNGAGRHSQEREERIPYSPIAMSSVLSPVSDASGSPPEGGSEEVRGRNIKREGDGMDTAEDGAAQAGGATPRKRRRSRKGQDKRYMCDAPNCGRAYSRAEHLYRHQLNHQPKEIFRCTHPGCNKQFVRNDLQTRHMERHLTRQNQRRDSTASVPATPTAGPAPELQTPNGSFTEIKTEPGLNGSFGEGSFQSPVEPPPPKRRRLSGPVNPQPPAISPDVPAAALNGEPLGPPWAGPVPGIKAEPGWEQPPPPRRDSMMEPAGLISRRQSVSHPYPPPPPVLDTALAAPPPPITPVMYSSTTYANFPGSATATNFPAHTPTTAAPGLDFAYSNANLASTPYATAAAATEMGFSQSMNSSGSDMDDIDDTMMFNNTHTTSPNSRTQDIFTGGLENHHKYGRYNIYAEYPEFDAVTYPPLGTPYHVPPKAMEAMGNIIDPSKATRNARIFATVVDPQRVSEYIEIFFEKFYHQVPIFHKPTFTAANCQPHLLLTIILIGAFVAQLKNPQVIDDIDGMQRMNINMLLALLRWDIFSHDDFEPPAKLWVFQSLLLIEMYEKLYATRKLHERAHIHHGTTITLMRRGTSFAQTTSSDEGRDDAVASGSEDGRDAQAGAVSVAVAPENEIRSWWNKWSYHEAIKRTVFFALLLDATHAAMFGHTMAIHAIDIETKLPCDERLWECHDPSYAKSMYDQENKGTLTLNQALKASIAGQTQEMYLSTFGRIAIMSGFISIFQGFSLTKRMEEGQGLNGAGDKVPERRKDIIEAIGRWRAEFEDHIMKHGPSNKISDAVAEWNIPTRETFYCLANLSFYVDVVKLQMISGAKKLIGRKHSNDYMKTTAQSMREWARTPDARKAVFYAIRLLRATLFPDGRHQDYDAASDLVLCRPWAMYYAALTVWAYGFLTTLQPPQGNWRALSPAQNVHNMEQYLMYDMNVSNSEDFSRVRYSAGYTGLLAYLRDRFALSRWELLTEAAMRLECCLDNKVSVNT